MGMIEKKIINYLYQLTRTRGFRKLIGGLELTDPVDILEAYNAHHGFTVGPEDLCFDVRRDAEVSLETAGRIAEAYRRAKRDQPQDGPYAVSGMWNETLGMHYGKLTGSVGDDRSLASFLGTFFHEGTYGLSASGAKPDLSDKASVARFMNSSLNGLLMLALYLGVPYIRKDQDSEFFLFDQRITPSRLYADVCRRVGIPPGFPRAGQPFGLRMRTDDGYAIVPKATWRHLYAAHRIREMVVAEKGRKRVAEIGAGYGAVPYYLLKMLRQGEADIWVFDIPEVCIVSSYFLIEALPEVDVVLYGEGVPEGGPRSTLHIQPNWAIQGLGDRSLDLVFNFDSMPEIPEPTVIEYLRQISRLSARFYSYNQDSGRQGQTRLSQLDLGALNLRRVMHHVAWIRHGYFESVYERMDG